MIFHPVILALLLTSLLTTVMIGSGAVFGGYVLTRWDLASGSRAQVAMERRTYLISIFVVFAAVTELLSLLLFIYNAEHMSSQFVGAMCAVGTLNANSFGFPALLAKIVLFFLCAQWLIMNHLDAQGYDYPLIRWKYALLMVMAPTALVSAGLQLLYFLNLDTDVITSCCSKLFTSDSDGVSAEMAGMDEAWSLGVLYAVLAMTVVSGMWFRATGQGGILYAVLTAALFVVGLVAVVSVISLYVYEHPHHHCPFCLLKPEYGYIGYFIYIPLFAGTSFGIGAGSLLPISGTPSLREVLPGFARRFTSASLMAFLVFAGVVSGAIYVSALRLF